MAAGSSVMTAHLHSWVPSCPGERGLRLYSPVVILRERSAHLPHGETALVLHSLGKTRSLLALPGRQATSSAMAFATTWALGQVARRYYAGGRTMETAVLKDAFAGLLAQARTMQAQYLPQMQDRARTLDVQQVLRSIRG